MAIFTAGVLGANMDLIAIGDLAFATPFGQTPTSFGLTLDAEIDQFFGSGFLFGPDGLPLAGVITGIQETIGGFSSFTISGLNLQVGDLMVWIATDATDAAKASLLAGSDVITGGGAANVLRGFGGDDTIAGGEGANNYLRGDDGNDSLVGSSGFDDINGNKGDDTVDGGAGGADWLVGGQGNDLITAHAGDNLLYGNLGNDTLVAGSGADVMRGGQGDDSLAGGSGADFISGDRGNDTMSGGAGPDIFHGSQDAGVDRVLDFNLAEGDRVMLDPGTTFTVSQVGADTVIEMGAGNQMILVGVQASTLTGAWIFEG